MNINKDYINTFAAVNGCYMFVQSIAHFSLKGTTVRKNKC